MRLIDADALKRYIDCGHLRPPDEICLSELAVVQMVDRMPTIEAEPVRHGRWEKCWQEKSKHYFQCSNCQTAYMDGVSGAIAPEYGSRAWMYCPHCGAKMDGKEERSENG